MSNIQDLLNQNKQGFSNQASKEQSMSGLEITPPEKKHELNTKMGEIERKDIELESINKARAIGLGYLSLQHVNIDQDVLKLISEQEAKTKKAVCFYYVPYQELRLASPLPDSEEVKKLQQRLKNEHHTPVKIYLVSQASFAEALAQYAKLPKIRQSMQSVEISSKDLEKFKDLKSFQDLTDYLKKINTTEIINLLISVGLQFSASDIHLESKEQSLALRYRIDGVLQDAAWIDKSLSKPLASRIKLLSKLKINVTDKPQDGHFVIVMPKGKIDVRVSTLPTNYGESIVMRILRSDIALLKLEGLGLNEHHYAIIDKEIKRPNGMLIACGPTGSGKTTTLYAILGKLNKSELKILTIEDPIEYQVSSINQSQVNKESGYTFAAGLRSLVRQDPDIILVGEMRDEETVEISVNAALTGHLVLSTMHTNDAAGAIPRFLSMGAKPYLLAPALNTIIAQRLIRLLCKQCRQETNLTPELKKQAVDVLNNLPAKLKRELGELKFFNSPGCASCHSLGFKGRIGIFEVFVMTSVLEKAILAGELSALEIKKLLIKQEMLTMAQDGILKALSGQTSVEEVFRVVEER